MKLRCLLLLLLMPSTVVWAHVRSDADRSRLSSRQFEAEMSHFDSAFDRALEDRLGVSPSLLRSLGMSDDDVLSLLFERMREDRNASKPDSNSEPESNLTASAPNFSLR